MVCENKLHFSFAKAAPPPLGIHPTFRGAGGQPTDQSLTDIRDLCHQKHARKMKVQKKLGKQKVFITIQAAEH